VAAPARRVPRGIRHRARASRRPAGRSCNGSCQTAVSIFTTAVRGSQRHGEGLLRAETRRLRPASEPLRKARERILALGGLQATNSYVKINLSLFGLYPRQFAPTVPVEITLLPGNVLYEMSS